MTTNPNEIEAAKHLELAKHFPEGCWHQPDGSYAGSCRCGVSFSGNCFEAAREAWALHIDPRVNVAASARGVAEGWKESLCYDQAGGTGQFELNDPEPDNHHSALYLQDPNGALFNISCDNREGLDIKRGQWMVAVLNAALTGTPEVEREAIALVERLRPWSEYSFHEMHQGAARDLFKQAADMIERLALRTPPAPAEEECNRCAGNGEIVTDWDSYVGDGKPATDAVETCPDCDGTGKVDAPDPFTTGFIAGRNAAAGVADSLAAEEDEAIAGMDYSDAKDRARCAIVAKEFRRAAKKIRAIEAPGEGSR